MITIGSICSSRDVVFFSERNEVLLFVYVVKLHLVKAGTHSTRTSRTTRSSGETTSH